MPPKPPPRRVANNMRTRFVTVTMAAVLAAGLALVVTTATAQTPGYRAPRTKDGKPNLNGIWQALNTANWDIEAHPAGPEPGAGARCSRCRPCRARASSKAARFPTAPRRWPRRRRTAANRLKLDPEIKCYLPGVPRGMYQPFPFQIIQSPKHIMMVHEFAGAVRTVYMDNHIGGPGRQLDGLVEWALGRRNAGHRHHRLQRPELVRPRRQFPQRCAARRRTNHRAQSRDAHLRSDDRGSQSLHAALEDQHAALPAGGSRTRRSWNSGVWNSSKICSTGIYGSSPASD